MGRVPFVNFTKLLLILLVTLFMIFACSKKESKNVYLPPVLEVYSVQEVPLKKTKKSIALDISSLTNKSDSLSMPEEKLEETDEPEFPKNYEIFEKKLSQRNTELQNKLSRKNMTINYSQINFDEYKKKEYVYNTGYYDKYFIYYKSYFYDNEETNETIECVKEYYFVGEKNSLEEVILCGKFENIENHLYAYIYNSEGKRIIDSRIAGYLYYEGKINYNSDNLIVLGFCKEVLENPIIRELIYINNNKGGIIDTGSLWGIVYDFQNNILSQFDPTK